jgi:hypothetical protein
MGARVDPEFVVAAPEVLHERVAAHDHACAVVVFEAAHRSQPGLQPSMVRLDPVVRVLLGVVERAWHELINDRQQGHARSVTTSVGAP